jgi:hypothetical protein
MYHPNSQFLTTSDRSMARAADCRVASWVREQLHESLEIEFLVHTPTPYPHPLPLNPAPAPRYPDILDAVAEQSRQGSRRRQPRRVPEARRDAF